MGASAAAKVFQEAMSMDKTMYISSAGDVQPVTSGRWRSEIEREMKIEFCCASTRAALPHE
jgi:hypothetical protein